MEVSSPKPSTTSTTLKRFCKTSLKSFTILVLKLTVITKYNFDASQLNFYRKKIGFAWASASGMSRRRIYFTWSKTRLVPSKTQAKFCWISIKCLRDISAEIKVLKNKCLWNVKGTLWLMPSETNFVPSRTVVNIFLCRWNKSKSSKIVLMFTNAQL